MKKGDLTYTKDAFAACDRLLDGLLVPYVGFCNLGTALFECQRFFRSRVASDSSRSEGSVE
jgi:hypothetical protein